MKTLVKRPMIACIGSGSWGKNLVRNFYQLDALKLICDKNTAILKAFQKKYPEIETSLDFSDALRREDVHGVVISTPAETHFPFVREALLAGKHVFVEKPLALKHSNGRELVALAEEKEKILMVGHLLQYHPGFIKLKEIAGAGELGRINHIYSHRLNLGKIRREENILWSFAPHDISMILTLANETPESILATGGYYLHKKIADVTTTHMSFSSGLRAQIFVSWLHPFKEQKLVVVGDKKMAVFDDTLPWNDKLLLYPHEIHWQNSMPVPTKVNPERVAIEPKEPLRNECAHFLDCIRCHRRPLTDGHEGLRVLKVLNASQRSLNLSGQKIRCKQLTLLNRKSEESHGNIFVHETAAIDPEVEIGSRTKIWHCCHILSHSKLGDNCNIGQNVVIGPDVTIGSGCKIQNNVSVYKGVTLEDDVFCGPSMVFTNIINPRATIRKMDQVRKTLVKKGATIGANATIVCGTTLGRYCLVGAGSVVTRDVPDHALVFGNPAIQRGWVCECGERLSDELTCLACRKQYREIDGGLAMSRVVSRALAAIGE